VKVITSELWYNEPSSYHPLCVIKWRSTPPKY